MTREYDGAAEEYAEMQKELKYDLDNDLVQCLTCQKGFVFVSDVLEHVDTTTHLNYRMVIEDETIGKLEFDKTQFSRIE